MKKAKKKIHRAHKKLCAPVKLAALIGRGGRLPAIYKCCQKIKNLDLVLVVSHKKESPGIGLAKKWSGRETFPPSATKPRPRIESLYFRLSDWKERGKSRKGYNLKLAKILKKRKINFIVMAGWDLIMSDEFLKQFPNMVINIHPSLCPAFPGMNAEKQAMDLGVRYTGCTLHFVDPGVDTGPIILQRVVEIKPQDTIRSLQKRIHKKEEEILCQGIKLYARGKLKIRKRRKVVISGQ